MNNKDNVIANKKQDICYKITENDMNNFVDCYNTLERGKKNLVHKSVSDFFKGAYKINSIRVWCKNWFAIKNANQNAIIREIILSTQFYIEKQATERIEKEQNIEIQLSGLLRKINKN